MTAIIGRNGEGKSTPLKILAGTYTNYDGELPAKGFISGFLPQLIESFETLSGGERLNLKNLADTIWHIQHGKTHVFNGDYEDYQQMLGEKISTIEPQRSPQISAIKM